MLVRILISFHTSESHNTQYKKQEKIPALLYKLPCFHNTVYCLMFFEAILLFGKDGQD